VRVVRCCWFHESILPRRAAHVRLRAHAATAHHTLRDVAIRAAGILDRQAAMDAFAHLALPVRDRAGHSARPPYLARHESRLHDAAVDRAATRAVLLRAQWAWL